jgi:hypothetical protein
MQRLFLLAALTVLGCPHAQIGVWPPATLPDGLMFDAFTSNQDCTDYSGNWKIQFVHMVRPCQARPALAQQTSSPAPTRLCITPSSAAVRDSEGGSRFV